jgi:hypothetical protein
MVSREIVIISDLVPAKSVLSLLDGSAMFYIANPYFKDTCPYDSVKDDILKPVANSNRGCRLQSPRIYFRKDQNSGFNKWYILAWKNKKEPKTYFIYKPFSTVLANLSTKHNIRISVGVERAQQAPNAEDRIMAAINYQLLFATEVLLVARMFNINLKEQLQNIHNNDDFLVKFGNLVNEKILAANKSDKERHSGSSRGIKITHEYINSFIDIPVYKRIKETWYPVDPNDLNSNKAHFPNLLEQVRDFITDTSSKYPLDNISQKIINGVYSVAFCPTFKAIVYENKNHEIKGKFDSHITVWLAIPGARMPTKIQKSSTKTDPCTCNDCVELWGGTAEAPSLKNFSKHVGCIFFQPPKLDYKFYKVGQPEVVWSVDKFTTRKVDATSGMDYDYGNEIFDDDEYNASGITLDRDEEEIL